MFADNHYVPILKLRQGEVWALETFTAEKRTAFTPLLEPPPPGLKRVEKSENGKDYRLQTLDEIFPKSYGKTLKKASQGQRTFLDGLHIPEGRLQRTGESPLSFIFSQARSLGLPFVPVTGINRPTAYQADVAEVLLRDRRGIGLRLTVRDLFEEDGQAPLEFLQKRFALKPTDVDLIIDLAEMRERDVLLYLESLPSKINGIKELSKWRTLTLASGAFPDNLSDVKPSKDGPAIAKKRRFDWSLWRALRQKSLKRQPTFADYAVQAPAPLQPLAGSIYGSANRECPKDG